MTFSESVKSCFRKYADFSGRASRSEYWWFVLFNMIVYLAVQLLLGKNFLWIAVLALLLPGLAVMVRRLHDTNHSGWWWFISLIPLIGSIILLIWYVQKGTAGINRFGEDPLADREEIIIL